MNKIALHSVPRSGSTWLGNIINSHPEVCFKYQPLFSYAFKGYLDEDSSLKEVNRFYDEIIKSKDEFINQKEGIENKIIPSFIKHEIITHTCYKEVRYHNILENLLKVDKDIKVVLLIRNPLAVLYSWYKAPKEFKPEKGWLFEEEWLNAPKKNLNKIEEFNGYSKWKEATLLFHKLNFKYPNQVVLIKYSNLIKDTPKQIEKLFDFLNLNVPSQTLDFITSSKSVNHSDAYSVFKQKQKDTNWQFLPKHIISYIKRDLKNTDLEIYLDD